MTTVDLELVRRELGALYHVEQLVAHDRLGIVVAAQNSDGIDTLITMLAPAVCDRLERPQAFVEEVERAGRIEHPGLLPTLGAGLTPGGYVYFSTMQPRGTTARQYFGRHGVATSAEIAMLGRKVAEAVAVIHDAGLLHGAISPDVVFIDGDSAQLARLGVHAGLIAAGLSSSEAGSLLGSTPYESPEQRASVPIDLRSDVYALGATLYEALTGKAPFGGRTTITLMASVLADQTATSVRQSTRESQRVVTALLRSIENDAEDRWQTAEDFARALDPGTAGSGVSKGPPESTVRRRGCLAALAIAPLLALSFLRQQRALRAL